MTDVPIEIAAADVNPDGYDRIFDIRHGRDNDPAFPAAEIIDLDDLTADPLSFVQPLQRVLVVCDIGVRSRVAVAALRSNGVTATSLAGGADELRRLRAAAGPAGLSQEAIERFDRQIRLTGFGVDGQRALGAATVTVVGAGGLGCPALSYLVTAGVGAVTIVDHDVVELSNLQRQPLYTSADVGTAKVDAAATALSHLNPLVTISTMRELVSGDNADEIIGGSDVIIDATDNFAVRYALNRATARNGIPLIYGSVYAFEGQFAAFDASTGPCYRCLFPFGPSPDSVLDCSTVGILGAVTGVIGSLQAAAALQIAAGVDHRLFGSLTMYDARTGRFDRVSVAKRSDCIDCSGRS
ncbi:MAG: ThiF family adenylyltransferase [Acidimicrobiia bacterium]